jgi:hypothetical protein
MQLSVCLIELIDVFGIILKTVIYNKAQSFYVSFFVEPFTMGMTAAEMPVVFSYFDG